MTITTTTPPADVLSLQARVQELEDQLASAVAAQRSSTARLELFEEIVQRMPFGLHVYRLEDAADDRSLVLVAASDSDTGPSGARKSTFLRLLGGHGAVPEDFAGA